MFSSLEYLSLIKVNETVPDLSRDHIAELFNAQEPDSFELVFWDAGPANQGLHIISDRQNIN